MALPKKRKRLDEPELPGQGKQEARELTKKAASQGTPESALNRQMEKAFEIVENIGHVHPTPDHTGTGSDPTDVHLRVSLKGLPADSPGVEHGFQGPPVPMLDVNLRIPSLVWKVPILRGVARNLIRKLTKG
ncbi:MAG: hypothetical protein ABFD70_13185 [Syntrophaceae bacterium]|nr:hypothetical protein [Deltaproteobacteria bacterium]